MRRLRALLAAAVLLGTGALLAWPATAATKSVSIEDIAYKPASVTINAGDTVSWTNNDSLATAPGGHTVTSDSGAFASPNLTPNSGYNFTFGAPGTYAYHCEVHSSMHGTVVVQATSTSSATTTTRPVTTTARATTTTRRTTTSLSSTTSTSLEEETTTTEESTTTSSTADIEINEDDGGGVNGAAVALLTVGILGVLGGGGYLLYRMRAGRF